MGPVIPAQDESLKHVFERGTLRLNICAHRSALKAMVFRCGPMCDATHVIIFRINSLLAVRPSIQSKAMQCSRTLRFATTCAWIYCPSIYRVYLKCVDESLGVNFPQQS